MKTFDSRKEITEFLVNKKAEGKTIGFVPTMGALHNGHLELMRRAKNENDILVVSIFVNPIQFNNPEDLEKYPRDIDKDLSMLQSVNCDVLFYPSVEEMYPEKINKTYDFGDLDKVMEGANRPGHFNGVAIVVSRLFNITIPDKAYFGEKDFQQLAIIKRLVEIEKTPVEIIPCPIVREDDGLAMSSRNQRLTEHQRKLAPQIYKTLQKVKEKSKYLTPGELKEMINHYYDNFSGLDLEYFEITDDIELKTVWQWTDSKGIMAFIVVNAGKIRLIDNIRII